MKIGQVLDEVYDEEIGWRPSSGAVKPAHVANGLVRAVCGVRYRPDRLHEFVVWWRAGRKPDDARSLDALLEAQPSLYGAFADSKESRGNFDRARRYAEGLLGSEKSLFPSMDNSSFSLTSVRMVTRDGNDRRLGLFGAALLGDRSDGDSLAASICLRSSSRIIEPVAVGVRMLAPNVSPSSPSASFVGPAVALTMVGLGAAFALR